MNKKIEKPPVEQAAEIMTQMSQFKNKINKKVESANKRIDEIKNDLSVTTEDWIKKVDELNIELEKLAEKFKKELFPPDPKGKEKKTVSIKLISGEFGFKKTSNLEIADMKKTAKLIEEDEKDFAIQTGISDAFSRKPNIDKRKLKGFPEDTLEKFGIKQKKDENFFCTVSGKSA